MKVNIEVELPDNLTIAQLDNLKHEIRNALQRGALAALQRAERMKRMPPLGPMGRGGPVHTGLPTGGGPVEFKNGLGR